MYLIFNAFNLKSAGVFQKKSWNYTELPRLAWICGNPEVLIKKIVPWIKQYLFFQSPITERQILILNQWFAFGLNAKLVNTN